MFKTSRMNSVTGALKTNFLLFQNFFKQNQGDN